MSESDVPRRMRLVAVGAALVAVVFALVAVIVVVTRGGGGAKAQEQPGVAPLADREVAAAEVVRLQRGDTEIVVEGGVAKGLRVKDAALAGSLGLEEGDVITAISGKPVTRELDVYDAILRLGTMNATIVYVEILRKDQPTLLRWRLDGDLRKARYGSLGTTGLGTLSGTSATADPDPLLDTIVKVDDRRVKLPRKTADALLADMQAFMKGARVVPSMKNGVANGMKLYAIRPSSVFARLGLQNGDTVHAINGHDITSPDKMLEAYAKLRDADDFALEVTRRGQTIELYVEITK